MLGVKGRKDEKASYRNGFSYLFIGLFTYFLSGLILITPAWSARLVTVSYTCLNGVAVILIITGGSMLARTIKERLSTDVFNRANETFPQEEKLIRNECSINLPARYKLKGQLRDSWINFISPARGLLSVGSPGSGKSRFVIEPAIRQLLAKGHALCLYDFKYPDLSAIAYNHFLKNRKRFGKKTGFYVIHLDDLSHSHRCNPLAPEKLTAQATQMRSRFR